MKSCQEQFPLMLYTSDLEAIRIIDTAIRQAKYKWACLKLRNARFHILEKHSFRQEVNVA